ncbi:MAG TPA: hypothetical protein VFC07_00885, partial [Verrucomicrobiae bacterium]|nr:hypothetical protein [Verrucomicrobiae bacterium]
KFSIDLGDTAANERADVQCGQMSRQERSGNRSRDWQADIDQMSAEHLYILKKAQAEANEFKIPIDLVLMAYGFGQPVGVAASTGAASGTPAPDGTK